MSPLFDSSSRQPPLLVFAAAAVVVSVLVTASWPQPSWAWLAVTIAYIAVEVRWEEPAGAGWVVAPAAAAALHPSGAMLALLLAIGAVAVIDSRRDRDVLSASSARIVAHVPLIAVFLAGGGAIAGGPAWSVAFGGAVCGAVAFGVALLTRRLLGAGRIEEGDLRPLVESIVLGAVAALLGAVAHALGWLIAPVVVAGLLVVAAADASRREATATKEGSVAALVLALEAKDLYTRGHSERVAVYAGWLGEELGLRGDRLRKLRYAALLHDVGKLTVPRHLIRKAGRLTSDEFCEVQQHAVVVPDVLAGIDFLGPVVPSIAEHHIHFDGSGYGRHRYRGARVSLEARILAVADAFDAMTTHRPYRMALSVGYAMAELDRCAGSQFDPEVVAAFTRCLAGRSLPLPRTGYESDADARRVAERSVAHG